MKLKTTLILAVALTATTIANAGLIRANPRYLHAESHQAGPNLRHACDHHGSTRRRSARALRATSASHRRAPARR